MPTSITLDPLPRRSNGKLSSAANFPPPTGYFVPAKMPMNVIYPRPNSETQTHARHRWAHTRFKFQIPIGVQGGAWPFKYEIIYDTSGAASIGQFYGDANYGILEIDNASLEQDETYEYTVRVTGCDGDFVDIARDFTVDDDMFVFVQDGYEGEKNGTIDQPLASFADWYGGSAAADTYAHKIAVWRGGEYTVAGVPDESNGNIVLTAATKSASFVGFPSESPVFDCTEAKFYSNDNQLSDFYSSGIHYKNAKSTVANSHYFWFASFHNRITFWGNKFTDMIHGTSGNDNNCAIFVSSTASEKNYFYYADNLWQDVVNQTGNNGGYCDFYYASNILIERNKVKDCKTAYGFWCKASTSFVTVRGNHAYENCEGLQITVGFSLLSGVVPHDHEVCWNRIVVPVAQSGPAVSLVTSNYWEGQHYNVFFHRNTVVGGTTQIQYKGAENYYSDANIICSNNLSQFNTSIITEEVQSLTSGATINTLTDASGELLGAAGFATHGWRPY